MNTVTTGLETNRVRSLLTFRKYPEFPAISANQLDHLLNSLKIQPISALEWDWPRSWRVGPRNVNDSMLFWFQTGSGQAWVREPNNVFQYEAGDMVLIPQGAPHMVQADDSTEAKVYAVHFYATLFGGIDFLELIGFPYKLSNRNRSFYGEIVRELTREFAVKSPGWNGSMTSVLHSLALHTLRYEAESFRDVANIAGHEDIPRLFPVVEWIDQHLEDNLISVRDLARRVYLSETHFRRLFKQVFGTSPVKFIRNRRIDHACALLRTSKLSVKEISQQCGFSDTSFFSRVFRSVTGQTPASYRHTELL